MAQRRFGCILPIASLCLASCVSPSEPYNSRGVALFNSGQVEEARAEFMEAAAVDPVNPDAFYNLASTYHRLGNGAEAERNYLHCLALDPEHAKAHHALTVLLLEENRVNEAFETVQRWEDQSPGQPEPMVEMAWLEKQAGRTEQARQILHQVLAINPRHPRALAELASIYESGGESERALALYQRALAAHPNHPDLTSKVADLRGSMPNAGLDRTASAIAPGSTDPSRASRDLRFQMR